MLLFVLENAVLCVPLALLKSVLHDRSRRLAGSFFLLLPEEAASIELVDRLLFASLGTLSALVPALQLAIYELYYRKFHPWASVLKPQ